MIWEELNPSLIFTQLHAQDYTDVMKQVGGAMTKAGYTKASYSDALIDREQEYPTGLDVDGFGVAIPHTPVEHVNKEGIAIAVLETPIEFIQMGSDDEIVPVRIVFMLAVANPQEHIDQLQRILSIIQDTNVLAKLLAAKAGTDIIEIIKEKENSL